MVAEDTNCCVRNCCGNCRPFDMQILDLYKNEIIHFHRPLACSSCCFPCCLQSIEVSVPPGQFIGRVEQKWSPLFPNYSVKNSNDETVLRIEGPFFTSSCCCTGINFRVNHKNELLIESNNQLSIVQMTDSDVERRSSGQNHKEMVWLLSRMFHRCRFL